MDKVDLNDLELTSEEMQRFTKAFRNDEFKKLFSDYCEEISDPANRKLYEKELTQLEAERNIDVTFINPEPGYVIKTSVNGKEKVFINVSQCDKVEKPSCKRDVDSSGNSGLFWSIPHTQSPPRKDVDNKGTLCSVYDVVFHPDTLHLAQKNPRFKKLLTETACDAVSNAFHVKIDSVNLKFPKIAFKGAVKPTVIRKQSTKPTTDYEPSPIDQIYPPLKTASTDAATSKPKKITKSLKVEYTTPTYNIVHRRNVELHEMTNELDAKINLTVPSELVVTIDLPLLNSTNEVTLDVTERQIYLISEKPAKYKLQVDLPYDVSERDGNAKFDKSTRKLTITLPVIRKEEVFKMPDLCRDDSGVESDHVSPKDGNSIGSDEDLSYGNGSAEEVFTDANSNIDEFFNSTMTYELPTFSCNSLDNTMAFTLNVKNVDPDSIVVDKQQYVVQLKFASIGAGFFPINYGFCVKLPVECGSIVDVQPDAWDNNIILQLELENCSFYSYSTGLNLNKMEEHSFRREVTKSPIPEKTENANDLTVDVTVVSEKEIKIEISKEAQNSEKPQESNTADGQKRNKRRKKKQRSLSESNCDDLQAAIDEQEVKVTSTTKSIDITKSPGKIRSISESSNDEQMIPKVREFKSILKRRSSYNRSISESSVDDHVYSCSMDIGVGSIQEESGAELSESCKKTVRFDDNVRKQLFR
ncbi:Protein kintoun [Pseudolycoriella hygida]|uniref:Protein kintoun n=1 Tax=Pseudolycoriella hygida TaxID=35572 RepID=A0A9Q0S2H2_9DIPT|nr:Protein kintoun [Pseudolycoriella hygida]